MPENDDADGMPRRVSTAQARRPGAAWRQDITRARLLIAASARGRARLPTGRPAEQRVDAVLQLLNDLHLARGFALPAELRPMEDSVASLGASPGRVRHRHVALRTAWEAYEARLLVARMGTRAAAPGTLPAGSQRIALLVDDAADVLVTVGAFLRASGFDVRRASTAAGALAMLTPDLDLLVANHALPGISGPDLVAMARRRRPGLAAVIAFGFVDIAALSSLPPGVAMLGKPFRQAELHRLAESLLALPATSCPGAATPV
ncbi:MAG: histidine kinase [Belnapia sp.]|nr:histidine kinase [Belnapia sp.]